MNDAERAARRSERVRVLHNAKVQPHESTSFWSKRPEPRGAETILRKVKNRESVDSPDVIGQSKHVCNTAKCCLRAGSEKCDRTERGSGIKLDHVKHEPLQTIEVQSINRKTGEPIVRVIRYSAFNRSGVLSFPNLTGPNIMAELSANGTRKFHGVPGRDTALINRDRAIREGRIKPRIVKHER